MSAPGIRNVVLVHGGFVDGSGWQSVHRLLTADGYTDYRVAERSPRPLRGRRRRPAALRVAAAFAELAQAI
ncbi:hypothetical protein ACFPIJ_16400 [Dactylosporangium cerinum]|uniref:Alpha/beta hydrolase n=1 Tax=Dactylosporangium cerinum TaxID=1434730 RepID=A0ABV9VUC8_9ACTN